MQTNFKFSKLIFTDTIVTEGVVFADIVKNKLAAVMTALAEDVANSGRMFVLADSAHEVSDRALHR